jgi:hypothetical protein
MFKKILKKTKTESETIGYNEDECLILDTPGSAKELANGLYPSSS